MHTLAKSVLFCCSLLAIPLAVTATEATSNSNFVEQKRQQDHLRVNSSVDALLQALQRISEEKQQQVMAGAVHQRIQQWQQLAQQLANQGNWDQARQLLDQSLVELKTAIATLRDNETLVRSLNFDTPEEEFKYEAGRFSTYQMLLEVLVLPKDLQQTQRQQIEQWQAQAESQLDQALKLADQGDHEQALKQLQQAEALMMKAIRHGGIYLPGMISQK